jgi:hypothetical protein
MIVQTPNRNRYQALQSSGFIGTSKGNTWMRTWWTLKLPVEVEYRKRLFKTYICPIRPRYHNNMYMYLTTVGRDLAGVSGLLSTAGRQIFEPTSKCKYTRNDYSKNIPRVEKLEPPLFTEESSATNKKKRNLQTTHMMSNLDVRGC